MKEIVLNDVERLSIDILHLRNLSLLLEDYFYQRGRDEEYLKHQSLATVIARNLNNLDKDVQEVIKEIMSLK